MTILPRTATRPNFRVLPWCFRRGGQHSAILRSRMKQQVKLVALP